MSGGVRSQLCIQVRDQSRGRGLGNRLSPARRRIVFQRIVDRDGSCCNNPECPHVAGEYPLQIDHKDDDKANWSFENLQLLCQPCNVKKEHRRRALKREEEVDAKLSADGSVCVNETTGARPRETVNSRSLRSVLDVPEGGTTFHANAIQEPAFREFVLTTVIRASLEDPPRFFSKKELVAAGAEAAQCSTVTGNRHIEKLANPINGILEVFNDGLGVALVRLRERRN